jgi:hypothetical protein
MELLLAVARHAGADHGTHEFLEELTRLVEVSPAAVAVVVGAMVKTYTPTYDFEGRFRTLLSRLAELGQRQLVLQCCEQLRHVDGIPELFTQVRNAPQ